MSTALLVAAASTAWAQPATYTVERKLALKDPTPPQRQALERGADEFLREMLAGGYQLASGDFNDDGIDEWVLAAHGRDWCGSAGCSTEVLQLRGGKWVAIGGMQTDGELAMTREKVGGYRALAVLDTQGAIAKDTKLDIGVPKVALMKPPPGAPPVVAPAPAPAAASAPAPSAGAHPLDLLAVHRWGGSYSVDCSRPQQPRLHVKSAALEIEIPGRKMAGNAPVSSVSAAAGTGLPQPGLQTTLTGRVRDGDTLIFDVLLDEQGRYLKVRGSPLVEAALGKPMLAARHRDCDAPRRMRDGLAARHGQRVAAATPKPAAVAAPAGKGKPGAQLVGRPIADEAGTLAAFQRAVGCDSAIAVSPFYAGTVGGRAFRFVGLDCAYVGGNATWAVQMLSFHDGQRYTQAVEFALLGVDSPVHVEGGKIVYEAKFQKDTDGRCCPTGRARVEVDPATLVAVTQAIGSQQKFPVVRGKPLP